MPLLFGIGVELHHKYVVTGCSAVGACDFSISLDKVTRYQELVMMSFVGWNLKQIESSQFTHFVADNVHRNI